MMLQALEGESFTRMHYYRVKKWIPFFFADITLFPIQNEHHLNQLIQGLDQTWVNYIPNRLENRDVRNIFGTDDRSKAAELVDGYDTKVKFTVITKAYNRVGYVRHSPVQWPKNFLKVNLSDHSPAQAQQFVKVVLGAIQLSENKRRFKKKIFTYLRSHTSSESVCSFCHCDYGVVYRNFHCDHLRYFHQHCIAKFIRGFQLRLECPVVQCSAPIDIFAPSAGVVELESMGIACSLCGQELGLGELYTRSPHCGHIYHQACYSAAPVCYSYRKCYAPECNVYFTLERCKKDCSNFQDMLKIQHSLSTH